jgi:pheromone shutdown protein TraB
MYETLGDSGFKPGDEFRTAMQMAQQQGATIVLGDQDVQVTLRRLTQALKATDWQKLQAPDVEQKLNALLPGQNGIAAPPPARENYTSNEAFKKDLSEYVENLKSRESVRGIMVR